MNKPWKDNNMLLQLREADRSRFLNENPNLTDSQKDELIELFKTHNELGNDIKWGSNEVKNWQYKDFTPYIIKSQQSGKKFWQKGFKGITEGVDYITLYKSNTWQAYQPLTWKGAVVLASNYVGPEIWTPLPDWCLSEEVKDLKAFPYGVPKEETLAYGRANNETLYPGAKWCISMQTSDEHWNRYNKDNVFIFVFNVFDSHYTYDGWNGFCEGFNKIAIQLPRDIGDIDYDSEDPDSMENIELAYVHFFPANDTDLCENNECWGHNWTNEEDDNYEDYYDAPFNAVYDIIYDCLPQIRF